MSTIVKKVNSDLLRERSSATFNADDVTSQLYGKEEMHERRKGYKLAEDDPDYRIAERFPNMDRDDVYNELVRIFPIVQQKIQRLGLFKLTPEGRFGTAMMSYADAAMLGPNPFSLHTSMFLPAIYGQGTPEQVDQLIPKHYKHKFMGTYAQTEMGHGTYLRGLETTATYQKSTQEFIIHCPTSSSIKYWPGGLGMTSNAAIVMAQLVIEGKSYGPHAFFCLLRDLDTHQPLPGVELGDINRKFGYDEVDNGYLKFTHFKIPRTNMLMKNAQVSADGTYQRKTLPQITYLTMTFVRSMIVGQASLELAKASTIATRYSAVRHQTANSKGEEPQILSYQTQQMKIFPAITTAYAFHFCAQVTRQTYFLVYADMQSGDTSRLAELHALSSGLKAYCSDVSAELIEVCRRACGGHGYSNASGIPRIIQRMIPCVTYEGENTVLYLQCARSLMKFYRMAMKGEPVPATMQFLCENRDALYAPQAGQPIVLNALKSAFALNALRMISNVANKISSHSGTEDPEKVWNNHTVQLVHASKAYTMYLTVSFFMDALLHPDWEPKAKDVMTQCCTFYTVHSILENSGMFLQNGVLTADQITTLHSQRVSLLATLRRNAVMLVDAFDYPDRLLNSCLGRYDGQVYDALYEYAKSSSLNQYQVHPSYHKYVKPMQQALKSQL